MNVHEYTTTFQYYRGTVFNYCNTILHNWQDAEDMTNTIFTKLWINRKQIRINTIEGYIKRLIRNSCIDALRHRKRMIDKYQLIDQDNIQEDPTEERLLFKEVVKVIDCLPDQQRNLIRLRYYEGIEPREISALLGISDSTVRNQLCTGLKSIRKQMAKEF